MVDFTQFFNPSAWGSWNQPPQSMVGPKPPMSLAPPGAPGMAHPGMMPAMGAAGSPAAPAPGATGATSGGNPLASLFGGGGASGPIDALMSKLGPAMSGNPMLAKFGSAMMGGQNPLQAMMSNPGDFAKWAAQRRQAQPGVQANPVGNPQPPVPTQQPGMLGGLY